MVSIQIQLHAGIFHGNEPLCKAESTRKVLQSNDQKLVWDWNENIEFSINVR